MKKMLSTTLCLILVIMAILGACSLLGKSPADFLPGGETSATGSNSSGSGGSGGSSSGSNSLVDVSAENNSSADSASSSDFVSDTYLYVNSTEESVSFVAAFDLQGVYGETGENNLIVGFYINDEMNYSHVYYDDIEINGETKTPGDLFGEKYVGWKLIVCKIEYVQGEQYTYRPFCSELRQNGTGLTYIYELVCGEKGTYVQSGGIIC